MATTDGPEQDALFCIEGPDEEGCVWICSAKGRDVWCRNLGPAPKVAETLFQWLNEQGLESTLVDVDGAVHEIDALTEVL